MKKKTLLWILLDLVFLLVFNLFFFLLSKSDKPASVWIAYVFIHIAYLAVLATPYLSRRDENTVLGLSLSAISDGYFLVEFVVGVLIFVLAPRGVIPSLLIQILLAGIYAVILITALFANKHTADHTAKQRAESEFIKGAADRVRLLVGHIPDKDADAGIQRVYDLLHASPVASTPSAEPLEQRIMDSIDQLESAVNSKDAISAAALCDSLQSLIQKRNQIVKVK